MILSEAFKKDTLSKNISITPLVIIQKYLYQEEGWVEPEGGTFIEGKRIHDHHYFSTHNIEVQGLYFKPLLFDIPTIKNSVDFENGKYKISNLSLKIRNIEYNNLKGTRLSDVSEFYSLINCKVFIYYKTQSCTKLIKTNDPRIGIHEEDFDFGTEPIDIVDGCVKAYSGYIRDISHTDELITLKIEDLSDK